MIQAKKEHKAEAAHHIQIYFADSHGGWRWTSGPYPPSYSTLVSNKCSAIPRTPSSLRRLVTRTLYHYTHNYVAGSGMWTTEYHSVAATSRMASPTLPIAGEFMLDIHTLSLTSSWISDSPLTMLMSRIPAWCIILLEDLDATFTRSVTHDQGSNGSPDAKNRNRNDNVEDIVQLQPALLSCSRRHREQMSDVNMLSLGGPLNALVLLRARVGCCLRESYFFFFFWLLMSSTQDDHPERLDPALSCIDFWIEFRNACKRQMKALFHNFFPSTDEDNAILEGKLEWLIYPAQHLHRNHPHLTQLNLVNPLVEVNAIVCIIKTWDQNITNLHYTNISNIPLHNHTNTPHSQPQIFLPNYPSINLV